MAIVQTITCDNGGTVRIADDCCAKLTADEMERRRRAISRAILEIDRAVQTGGHNGESTKEDRPAGAVEARPGV